MLINYGNISSFFSQDTNTPDSLSEKFSHFFRELKRPTIQISGTYILTNRDKNFGDFMESLGMSRSQLSYLDKLEEKLTIVEGTKSNPNWTMILATSKDILNFILDNR